MNPRFILFPALLLSINAFSQSNYQESSALMAQWIGLESQKGKLQQEWLDKKQSIEQQLELFTVEKKSLDTLVAGSKQTKTDVDDTRLKLLQEQETLELEQTQLRAELTYAISKIKPLSLRLPPPMQAMWAEKTPLLFQDGISDSEKLERLLSLYSELDKFNDRIVLHRASLSIPEVGSGSQKIVVNQVYAGSAHGWYISDDGSYFGYGKSKPLGWAWFHGEAAEQELGELLDPDSILAVIAVLETPTTARFLPLPVSIK
ncbi:MAG: hypothetical protein ACI93R_002756 [Flavobacteriales bacterium]|jgi:hypothetical protein